MLPMHAKQMIADHAREAHKHMTAVHKGSRNAAHRKHLEAASEHVAAVRGPLGAGRRLGLQGTARHAGERTGKCCGESEAHEES